MLALCLGLLAPDIARGAEASLESQADRRYRDADRLAARGRVDEAAAAYFEASQLFLAASGRDRVALPLERLHGRALSALRRAANHSPAARDRLDELCVQMQADSPGLASPSACDDRPRPPAPEPSPAPTFVTAAPSTAPVPAAPPPNFPITLQLAPRRAVRAGLDVQWDEDARPDRVLGTYATRRMPAGPHIVRVRAPGFATTTLALTLGPAGSRHDVRLRRDRDARARIGLAVAYAGVGVGLLGVGAGLLADSGRALAGTEAKFADPIDPARTLAYFTRMGNLRAGQFATLGAGAGALLAAPAAAGNAKIAGVSLALGAAVVGVGAGLYARADRRAGLATPPDSGYDAAFFADLRGPQVTAAALLGGGGALFVGSLVALATHAARKPRRTSLDVHPQLGASQWSLRISAAF